MAALYFHYTSRIAAQLIIAAGELLPGSDGFVYLTDDPIATGAEAANTLGIPVIGPLIHTRLGEMYLSKPVEVVCEIPSERLAATIRLLQEAAAEYTEFATGRLLYSGKGHQYRYPGTINIQGLAWRAVGIP